MYMYIHISMLSYAFIYIYISIYRMILDIHLYNIMHAANNKMLGLFSNPKLEPPWLRTSTVRRWVYRNVCPELGS